jgi:hypothetical protein
MTLYAAERSKPVQLRCRTTRWKVRRPALATAAALALALAPTVTATATSDGAAAHRPAGGALGANVALGWHRLPTGSAENYRGVKAVSRDVVWVAGTSGEVLRTVNGGRT